MFDSELKSGSEMFAPRSGCFHAAMGGNTLPRNSSRIGTRPWPRSLHRPFSKRSDKQYFSFSTHYAKVMYGLYFRGESASNGTTGHYRACTLNVTVPTASAGIAPQCSALMTALSLLRAWWPGPCQWLRAQAGCSIRLFEARMKMVAQPRAVARSSKGQ
jgi:hypothetical protein